MWPGQSRRACRHSTAILGNVANRRCAHAQARTQADQSTECGGPCACGISAGRPALNVASGWRQRASAAPRWRACFSERARLGGSAPHGWYWPAQVSVSPGKTLRCEASASAERPYRAERRPEVDAHGTASAIRSRKRSAVSRVIHRTLPSSNRLCSAEPDLIPASLRPAREETSRG